MKTTDRKPESIAPKLDLEVSRRLQRRTNRRRRAFGW